MLIHKACCYLVLFSILLLPNCLLLLLLFTVSINFSMYPQHLHRGMVHYVMFLREGWLVIECDFKPLNDHDEQLPLLLLLLLWLWWLSLLLLLFCISKCFLWMKMMYCTSLIFSVPQKDFIKRYPHSDIYILPQIPTDATLLTSATDTTGLFDHGLHKRGSVTWTFMQTLFYRL